MELRRESSSTRIVGEEINIHVLYVPLPLVCSPTYPCSELYIGNTSPDMTDIVLKDFLSSTMQKVPTRYPLVHDDKGSSRRGT